jgi:hypothetical protein
MINFDCERCGKVEKAYLDGYSVGDRLLEGVKFICSQNDDNTFIIEINEEDKPYLSKLNIEYWLDRAKISAEKQDIFSCINCGDDIVPDNML